MKKNFLLVIVTFTVLIFLFELIGNNLPLKPRKWSRYYDYNSTYGWYTWFGADHLYGKHENQTNGYKTRGKKPSKEKKIILLSDSTIETSHKLEEMPEKYLEDHLPDYSVISFGSWGWGNDQQLLHLKENIKSIKPEYVILWWITNDLSDNMKKFGFVGPKPTFKIKNDKLIYPDKNMGDEYGPAKFYRFYLYRLINKSYAVLKEKFRNKDRFDFESKKLTECKEGVKYHDYSDLLKLHVTEDDYNKSKRTFGNKPMPYDKDVVVLPEKKKWISERINLRKRAFDKNFIDELFWNRNILTKYEEKKYKTANLLIKEMQRISNENNAKFIVFFPVIHYKKFYLFKDDTYKICFRGNEIEYSNKNVDEKLKLVFEGLDNVYITRDMPEFGNDFEDLFDGHLNNDANDFQMKKLSEIIKNN